MDAVSVPTEDERKRADRRGRWLYKCAVCGREFWSRRNLSSDAGPRVSVCGALLSPPVAHCLLTDDLGRWWWPKDEPMPDLLEIDRKQREALTAPER
jgi:DNA-directed RNA polymerase subunit RPC12/RpoP